MGQIQTQVSCYQVNYQCDNCKLANVVPNGITVSINPEVCVYVCPNCQTTINLTGIYPYMVYR